MLHVDQRKVKLSGTNLIEHRRPYCCCLLLNVYLHNGVFPSCHEGAILIYDYLYNEINKLVS